MGLNKQKGNMYGFVTHTWNPIKGRCIHNCNYCYMTRFWDLMKNSDLRLDEKELKTDLGSTDIWAKNVPGYWIIDVLTTVAEYPKNTYLFQTKNPKRFGGFPFNPTNMILGITLESDKVIDKNCTAPDPLTRVKDFDKIRHPRKMVTIEPVLDFDLTNLIAMIAIINPEFVNIGADSGGNKLPEPSKDKILALIEELNKFTVVKNKSNLKRLLK